MTWFSDFLYMSTIFLAFFTASAAATRTFAVAFVAVIRLLSCLCLRLEFLKRFLLAFFFCMEFRRFFSAKLAIDSWFLTTPFLSFFYFCRLLFFFRCLLFFFHCLLLFLCYTFPFQLRFFSLPLLWLSFVFCHRNKSHSERWHRCTTSLRFYRYSTPPDTDRPPATPALGAVGGNSFDFGSEVPRDGTTRCGACIYSVRAKLQAVVSPGSMVILNKTCQMPRRWRL